MAKLTFYYGVMGSAKTTQLLTTNFAHKEQGRSTLILSPAIDSRHDKGELKSRIGISAQCVVIYPETNLNILFAISGPDVILVDEAQFLSETQVNQLAEIVDGQFVNVNCYGLKTDFTGKPFSGSARLMEIADDLIEIPSLCKCGNKAIINARLINGKITKEGPQVLIGDTSGEEISYRGMCRVCSGVLK